MVSYATLSLSLLLAASVYGILEEGRKRGDEEDEVTRTDETLLDVLKDTPWVIIPLTGKSGRRDMYGFSPRLGREEEGVLAESSRSPPFAPRLGRGMMHFSPRLGRMA